MRTELRFLVLAVLVSVLQGCATQLRVHQGSDDAEVGGATQGLQFQSKSIAPLATAEPSALEPGDILLSAEPTLVSASIRLMTFAPVSHAAVYVGEGRVVDAMRGGVRVRALDELLEESAVLLVLRYPGLTAEQAAGIATYAMGKAGAGFNFLGITLHVPFSITRRLCELPLVTLAIRDACIRSLGLMHYLSASENRLFCSQLVLQAYRSAGVPVTEADSRIISPADILHMREGDVSSVSVAKPLRYVGHLKDDRQPPTLIVALD
jgi:hypothetical protein